MQSAPVVDILRRVPLFKELPEDKLAWISDHGEEVRLEPGTRIAAQGDPPDGFYVVLEGETEWTRKVGTQDIFVVKLGEGSIFAELILVLNAPYPTTGRAVTPVRLFKLDIPSFWEMLRICPEVLRSILATSVERAELHESVSQQHAKLVSLGTMAAGLAHELNNPAAAVARSAKEAREAFRESSSRAVKLGELEMSPAERAFVAGLPDEVTERAQGPPALDSLERSEREDEVAIWLEDHGVEEAWDLSPTLVGAGLDVDWLEDLADRLSDEDCAGDVLAWLAYEITGDELLREIRQASARISELVKAVKSYSHMDKASQKEADVHEGLENTLVMLGHKLKKGNVEVVREYAEDLPRVCAPGSELNQVWTNLVDNAIDAVDGDGHIKIRTTRENDRVLVEITDDGPGIPREIQNRIFEPFFTTKAVDKGTGLGLDISYRVVEDLGGDIRVFSQPGDTRFQVRLPIRPAKESSS
ncbi:MAG: ATP-binding protein [Actinomycetota bacterium]|nr:ATP-binding protein [Actinomycetota bacterium]